MSDIKSDPELTNDFTIPSAYYDKYRLVFSYYHLDKKLVRIGSNERQKEKRRTITRSSRGLRKLNDSWDSMDVSRKGDTFRAITTVGGEIPESKYIVN